MQVTRSEKTLSKVCVPKEIIKFRPSPNFKNMKKFLKSRTEVKTSPVEDAPLATSPVVITKTKQEPNEDVPVASPVQPLPPVQPPLPPYPPPPDSPPVPNIVIKKEKPDVEDTPATDSSTEPVRQEPEAEPAPLPDPQNTNENPNKPKQQMCKDFVKGICDRPVCRYSHEIDLSQLRDMFTFCKNYQNAVCVHPKCKYIHANIFEQAKFYRTGILPPQVTNANRRRQLPVPLPPPPPPPPPEVTLERASTPMVFRHPPPAIPPSAEFASSNVSDLPAGMAVNDEFRVTLPSSPGTSTLKRDWGNLDESSRTAADPEAEQFIQQCKNCEMMEYRLQYNKEKVEKQLESAAEFDNKMNHLNKKSERLINVLLSLMEEEHLKAAGVDMSGVVGEEDKSERWDSLSGSSRLSSVMSDDSVKNLQYGNANMSSLIKLLSGSSGNETMTSDAQETYASEI